MISWIPVNKYVISLFAWYNFFYIILDISQNGTKLLIHLLLTILILKKLCRMKIKFVILFNCAQQTE